MDSQNQCAKLGMYTSQQEIQANLIDWKNVISSEDVSILWIGQQIPTQTTATDKVYCQAWSIRRSEYQSVPCETQLNVFCQADLIGTFCQFFANFSHHFPTIFSQLNRLRHQKPL